MRVRPGEALALQELKKRFGVPTSHFFVVLAFRRLMTKIAPAVNYLLGRTAADSQLQAPCDYRKLGPRTTGFFEGLWLPFGGLRG